ncbi:MAG: nitrate reductase [Verrucomicrobiota bacterium]
MIQMISQMLKKHSLIREWNGPLTKELVQTPGRFGLGKVPEKVAPDATTTAICGFCATGCGLKLHLKDGEAINLSADTDYPVNLGMACPKGWEALSVLESSDRATMPLLRGDDGVVKEVDWEKAMLEFCRRFKQIQEKHGKASVAFLSTGQIPMEEMAMLGSLAKFGMGVTHGDGNTRQCMATSVVAYKQSFGFDSPPYTYGDFEESDVLVFVGSNLCIAHPIMWQRVLRNPHHPEIIVIDPRKTETAAAATQHLAIRPKSDLTLLYGLANKLIKEGWIDRKFIEAHTRDFSEFEEFVKEFDEEKVFEASGITSKEFNQLAEKIHKGKRVSFWWTMGVNQSHEGTRIAQSIINLALMTGNIGRPGTGANSITGQCNAMGSRLFSNTTNLLGGHSFQNDADRKKVAEIFGMDEELIPRENSWAYDQIIRGIDNGEIKGLWVIATNTAHSWINQNGFKKVREKLDFLVVQDIYHSTETAQVADLLLPAAGWGEKEGTFINSERRMGVIKKVKRAPGKALADFYIFKLIANYWGCADLFRSWHSTEDVFQTLKELSKGQPCDFTGVEDYQMIDQLGGVQWPWPEGANQKYKKERRLFEDGQFYHPDGKARFIFEKPRKVAEPTCSSYPFILLTGRGTSSQWHTQTRTGKSDVLKKLYPKSLYIEMHPEDMGEYGLYPQDQATIESRRGKIKATVVSAPTVQRGQIFMPMHYAKTNQLTYPDFDPYSREPSYKFCAVRIKK